MEPYGCSKPPVVKTKVSDVRVQILLFSNPENGWRKCHFWNGCTQGSFGARRRAILTGARNGLLGNGYAQGMGQIPDAGNLHPGAGNRSDSFALRKIYWNPVIWCSGRVTLKICPSVRSPPISCHTPPKCIHKAHPPTQILTWIRVNTRTHAM